MKKSIILGILGLAAGVASSYGQGVVLLDNYNTSTYNPITFGAALGGGNLTSGYTVGLFYVNTPNVNNTGNVAADASGTALPSDLLASFVAASGAGSTAQIYSQPTLAGYFTSGASFVIQPLSATSPVQQSFTMMLVAYNGSDYADSTIRGHSVAFYDADAAPSQGGGGAMGNLFAENTPMFSVYSVAPVPEPSTLALAGLGGFGMLMALRRKKA